MKYPKHQIKITMPVLDLGGFVDWISKTKGIAHFEDIESRNRFMELLKGPLNNIVKKHKIRDLTVRFQC